MTTPVQAHFHTSISRLFSFSYFPQIRLRHTPYQGVFRIPLLIISLTYESPLELECKRESKASIKLHILLVPVISEIKPIRSSK